MTPNHLHRASALFVLLALLAGASPASGDEGLDARLAEIAAAQLDTAKAVTVQGLSLNTGMAVLKVEKGTFFPASPVAGRVTEAIFLGSARLVLEPPDEVEKAQLELFTGKTRLEIKIDEAAFVLANDRAAEAIFKRAPAAVEPALATRATELFSSWRTSAERKQLDVDGALLADGFGDPLYQMYFAGWFSSEELGKFLYVVEPDAVEQVTLGQFVPIDLTEKEKRQASKLIHREQRRGRLIGVEIKDLGAWDTWVSASLRNSSAKLAPGGPGFEPQRYVVDLALADKDLEVTGRAQIQLQAQTGLTRIVYLELYKDLEVSRVQAASGEALPFRQNAGQVMVVLPQAPAAGETAVVEVFFEGPLFEKVEGGVFLLYETVHWHPHAGDIDRATYDVTFHWPGRLELLAGGKRVDGGEEKGGRRWERRSIDLPAAGLGFEVGKFHLQTRQVGHVAIRLGMMPIPYADRKETEERISSAAADSIAYFEEIFGPYPLDEMTLVLTPRMFSQALLGFITLSYVMMADDSFLVWLIGLEDPRTVIAHEIAHQWWGHQVGWKGYRDQWLSEAMANYASVLFARNKLGNQLRNARGPTSGWQDALLAETEDGRPVESLGPLVLGARLISSRGGDAYSSIVYRKGAVVLDMLARRFGEKAFLEMLKKTAEVAGHRVISTELFLDAIERLSGVELEGFAGQFIYGTGLPEVYYDYGFAQAEGGKWKITGTARQSAPYRFRYRVVVEEGGKFDVQRERIELARIADSALIVPVQIAVYDPAKPAEKKAKKAQAREIGNSLLQGHVLLKGESTPLSFEVDHEPREIWLDRREEVFGRFFNQRRHPKRMLLYQAIDRAAEDQRDEAQKLATQALTAEIFAGPSYEDSPKPDDLKASGRLLDGRVQLLLTRLHLDGGRDGEARAALAQARELLQPGQRPWWKGEIDLLDARLALHEGDFERAYRLLRKGVLKRGTIAGAEGSVLLAIAARATGHPEEEKKAIEEAKDGGAEVGVLLAARKPP